MVKLIIMQERKINLEEILEKSLNTVGDGSIKMTHLRSIMKILKHYGKEACRQALELAAENYSNDQTFISDNPEYLKQSILNTINQIE